MAVILTNPGLRVTPLYVPYGQLRTRLVPGRVQLTSPGLVLDSVTPKRKFVGTNRLAGVVKDNANTPLSRRVLVVDRTEGIVIRTGISDGSTGAFAFEGIAANRKYLVVAIDDDAPIYNAARQDYVEAVP